MSRLHPFNAERGPDGGASLQTRAGRYTIAAIESHETDESGGLHFAVRWDSGEVSAAQSTDLVKYCRTLLEHGALRYTAWDPLEEGHGLKGLMAHDRHAMRSHHSVSGSRSLCNSAIFPQFGCSDPRLPIIPCIPRQCEPPYVQHALPESSWRGHLPLQV